MTVFNGASPLFSVLLGKSCRRCRRIRRTASSLIQWLYTRINADSVGDAWLVASGRVDFVRQQDYIVDDAILTAHTEKHEQVGGKSIRKLAYNIQV